MRDAELTGSARVSALCLRLSLMLVSQTHAQCVARKASPGLACRRRWDLWLRKVGNVIWRLGWEQRQGKDVEERLPYQDPDATSRVKIRLYQRLFATSSAFNINLVLDGLAGRHPRRQHIGREQHEVNDPAAYSCGRS